MECIQNITKELIFVGTSDRRMALFENVYPIPTGVSYNSYLLLDEQTVLFDTVDRSVADQFYANVAAALDGRTLDFVIIQHMEPDHCASLEGLLLRYPNLTIVCNAKTVTMMKQFFPSCDFENNCYVVKEGDILAVGKHTLTFVMAPMVHWPEVMVTYDTTDKILFSADAFGGFGALSGNLFADEADLTSGYMDEMRRYYTNIVGKYGTQVQTLLKKAAGIDIRMICPLHGLIWRTGLGDLIDKYTHWATYTPEENGVVIAYASVYGGTENTVNILASKLAERGVKRIRMFDVSVTHPSYIVAEAFRCSHLVFASTTYNAGIFVNMENLLHDLAAHNFQNRTVAFIENGTWAPTAGKLMREIIGGLKGVTVLDETLTVRSALHPSQKESLEIMADAIAAGLTQTVEETVAPANANLNPAAMFKLSYGLFLLSAKDKGKDNACIINTVTQLTDIPKRVSVAVNKSNLTHDMILSDGRFNVSVLTESVPFDFFKQYGFQSGRLLDKFEGQDGIVRAENGILYTTKYANAYLSCTVIATVDCGTHTLFIASVDAAEVLSDEPSVTYAYYFAHIKPRPQPAPEKKTGYVCKICGYVYEGESLPEDFICPLCKHGVEDFEKL